MHEFLRPYYFDNRRAQISPPVPHVAAQCPDAVAFYLAAQDGVLAKDWHWLGYLYSIPIVNKDLWKFAQLCASAERVVPGLGVRYITELARLGGRERDELQYQQMLQLFAEVYAINRILLMPWSSCAHFHFEPRGKNGLRPEFQVVDGERIYNFEVKSPSLLLHQRRRGSSSVQLPVRITKEFTASVQLKNPDALLPRDNPVKDFLVSANEKFSGFPRGPGGNILVIVWDDFIYEPIGSLLSEFAGLLTPNSFHREGGEAVVYDFIDAVVCARQMNVFQEALAERSLPDDRRHMFDLSQNPYTPNVYIPTPWGEILPEHIREGFGALTHDDERLQVIAEYRMPEYIFYV